MKTRFFAILLNNARLPKIKHYLGFPPALTGGKDTRHEMDVACFLVIEENPDGVFLYRYDAQGACVGDTWHLSVDDAKQQAAYEFTDRIQKWENIPSDVGDASVYGLIRVKKRG